MRLPSALFVLASAALAVVAAAPGCSTTVAPAPKPEPALASLKDLGVDGRTYVADLAADRVFHVNRVFPAGDDLIIEDLKGGLVYLDGSTLNPRWAYYGLPRPYDAQPDVSESLVVGVCKGRIHAITRSAGVEIFEPREIPVVPSAGIVANETTAYVPTYRTAAGNRTIVAVNLADGYLGWGMRTASDVTLDLAKAGLHGGDMFYVASGNGEVLGIPAFVATERDPEPAWIAPLRSRVTQRLTVSGEELGVVTDDNRLVCLDRITGTTRWEVYPNSGEKATAPAQFSPSLAFYVCGGEMRAFDRATGAKAWAAKGPSKFVAQRGARTILTDGRGTLWAVETKTGKVLGTKSMPGWNFPARAAADATVVAISSAGMVIAVETGW
jgi:outer membrane protein assembly factor BamB